MEAVYFDTCFLRKKYMLFTLWLANKAFKYTRNRYCTEEELGTTGEWKNHFLFQNVNGTEYNP